MIVESGLLVLSWCLSNWFLFIKPHSLGFRSPVIEFTSKRTFRCSVSFIWNTYLTNRITGFRTKYPCRYLKNRYKNRIDSEERKANFKRILVPTLGRSFPTHHSVLGKRTFLFYLATTYSVGRKFRFSTYNF